jgi:hypothetical protein
MFYILAPRNQGRQPEDGMAKRQEWTGIHRMNDPATGEELANTVSIAIGEDEVAMEIGAALDPAIRARVLFRDPGAARRERHIEFVKRRVILNARKQRGDFAVPKPTGQELKRRSTMIPCPDCDGWGELERDGRLTLCPRCNGERMVKTAY